MKKTVYFIGAMGDDLAWKERLLKLENACVMATKKPKHDKSAWDNAGEKQ